MYVDVLCMEDKKKILFVCLGNICRSPSAEGVMRKMLEEAGRAERFVVDSAGISSYHRGELPDSRMRAHAARRGYNLAHRSRPVCTDDFYNFDLIIGMDDRNMDDLKERAPSTAEWKKTASHDGVLHEVCACRPRARPLLWRSRRLRVCARYSGRCLCRPFGRDGFVA